MAPTKKKTKKTKKQTYLESLKHAQDLIKKGKGGKSKKKVKHRIFRSPVGGREFKYPYTGRKKSTRQPPCKLLCTCLLDSLHL